MVTDMAATDKLQQALQIVHYLSPAVVILYYILALTISICTLHNLDSSRSRPRKILLRLTVVILLSYLVEVCLLVIDTLVNHGRLSSTDRNVYVVSSTLIWMILVASLANTESPVSYPQYGSWLIALLAEGLLLALGLGHGFFVSAFVIVRLTIQASRLLALVALPCLLFSKSSRRTAVTDEESAALLGQTRSSSSNEETLNGALHYGSTGAASSSTNLDYEIKKRKKEEEEREKLKRRLQESGSWFQYIASFSTLFPLMWPSKSRLLQLNVVGVGLCLLCARVLKVLEPRQLGIVLDNLDTSQGYVPVSELLLFMLYGFLSSSVISPIRRMLWVPVELNMQASLKTASYNQIMSLSRDFHTEKQSGELFKSIDQGRSITSLLDTLLFRTGPMLIDIVVAFSYLYHVFGAYMALDVAATTIIYLWASTYFINKQVEPQRKMQGLFRKESQLMYDTVGGWSSVSYFNRQAYEKERYSQAVDLAMLWERKTDIAYYIASAAQDTIVELGLIVAGILAVYQIVAGAQKVGSFAMLMAYWGSLIGGLAFFVHAQRSIRRDMIDAESLLELFQKEPTVKDGPNQFTFKCGTIHFHNVGFSYDGKKETIQDFNFHAVSGQKIALVGETGGGKSTILKLLFRFYDVQQGKILIDDQDIKEVSLQSLRQCIGVVPQDPALFNESVMENVRYSKLGASDEDVREACKAAAIHEKILTFSEGYQTKVGENGVKLSGGELQRIAIARVILKNPEIVLLDEATSAVDTETEACIQEALYKMTKGRTTITIAHRLSTVTSSDTIVVIKGGKIVESGPPHALLKAKGKFSELWFKQVGINPRPTNEEPVDEKAADQGDAPKAGHNERRTRLPEGSSSSNKSLRPTAPEFVPSKTFIPRHQRGPVAKGQSSPHPAHTSGHQESNDESTTKSNSGKPQQKRKLPANHLIDNVGSDTQWDTSDSKPEGAKQTETKKKRLNPAQRRRNNKSDPSASAFRPNQHDGPLDGPMLDESAESSAMELGSRRVSAPARPLSTITNTQEGGRAQRRRTQRWHNRNRQSLEPAHATTSAERSSSAWSNDTLHPPTPVVRLPSSADDTASKSEINVTGAGNGSVRFEPGL